MEKNIFWWDTHAHRHKPPVRVIEVFCSHVGSQLPKQSTTIFCLEFTDRTACLYKVPENTHTHTHTHTHSVTVSSWEGKTAHSHTPDLPLNPLPSSFASDLPKHQSHRHHELFWRELKGDAIGPFHTVKLFCHQQIWSALSVLFYLFIKVWNCFVIQSQLNSIQTLHCSSGEKRI